MASKVFDVTAYGATGVGANDSTDTDGVRAARAALAAAGAGVLYFPAGTYWLTESQDFIANAGVHEVIIRGDGMGSTFITFKGASAGTNGFSFGAGAYFGVEDLTITNSFSHGLWIGKGNTVGGVGYCSQFFVRNVKVQNCILDGIHVTNAYMGSFRDCWTGINHGYGYCFDGYQTSMHVERCWGSNNQLDNWKVNGAVYSTFATCGSDQSVGGNGWTLSNLRGVSFVDCGAESNYGHAIEVFTSDASASGLVGPSADIHGVTFENCFAYNNSAGSPGQFASFIYAHTANGRPMDLRIVGGDVTPATSSDRAFILSGASGSIAVSEEGLYYDGTMAPDQVSGSVTRRNQSQSGMASIVNLASPFAVPSNTYITVPWNPSFVQNDLNATVNGNGLIVPPGVNRIRVAFCVQFSPSSAGVRQVVVQKNGSNAPGLPQDAVSAASSGGTILSGTSPSLNVQPGDVVSLQVFQSSGAPLSVANYASTWFSIEAVN